MLELAELEQSGESLRDFKQKNKNDRSRNSTFRYLPKIKHMATERLVQESSLKLYSQ